MMVNCTVISEGCLSERTLKYRGWRHLVEGPFSDGKLFSHLRWDASVSGPSTILKGGLASKDLPATGKCSVICEGGIFDRTLKYREGRPLVEGPFSDGKFFSHLRRRPP